MLVVRLSWVGPDMLLGDWGAIRSGVEIKQLLAVRAVGELLICAVSIFLTEALAAGETGKADGGERTDVGSEHCEQWSEAIADVVPVFLA